MSIRQAREEDACKLLEIYAPIVEETATSFEHAVPSADEFAGRIATSLAEHDWLVFEEGKTVCGYAYGTPHRAREAYKLSVETSVYVSSRYRGRQVGSRLYAVLLRSLSEKGYHNAFAGITLPNEASVALHKSVGFETVGVFREVGYKLGHWHDVSWWQRSVSGQDM